METLGGTSNLAAMTHAKIRSACKSGSSSNLALMLVDKATNLASGTLHSFASANHDRTLKGLT
jgi:hypothetical protein